MGIEILIFVISIVLILIVLWKIKISKNNISNLSLESGSAANSAVPQAEQFGDYRLMPYCQSEDDYLSKLAHGVCNCWPDSSITRCAEWEPAVGAKCDSMPLYRYVSPDMLMGRRFGRINVVARRHLYP